MVTDAIDPRFARGWRRYGIVRSPVRFGRQQDPGIIAQSHCATCGTGVAQPLKKLANLAKVAKRIADGTR